MSRIKVLAQLDITECRLPQDGRFRFTRAGDSTDLRVSIMPSAFGEDAVLRLLDKAQLRSRSAAVSLDLLGFQQGEPMLIRDLAREPSGMLLVTGPTGSGKTTTLYAVLSEINTGAEKIITIEDPVEYELPGVLQIPVNERKGLTFATRSAIDPAARSRPDPRRRDPRCRDRGDRGSVVPHRTSGVHVGARERHHRRDRSFPAFRPRHVRVHVVVERRRRAAPRPAALRSLRRPRASRLRASAMARDGRTSGAASVFRKRSAARTAAGRAIEGASSLPRFIGSMTRCAIASRKAYPFPTSADMPSSAEWSRWLARAAGHVAQGIPRWRRSGVPWAGAETHSDLSRDIARGHVGPCGVVARRGAMACRRFAGARPRAGVGPAGLPLSRRAAAAPGDSAVRCACVCLRARARARPRAAPRRASARDAQGDRGHGPGGPVRRLARRMVARTRLPVRGHGSRLAGRHGVRLPSQRRAAGRLATLVDARIQPRAGCGPAAEACSCSRTTPTPLPS